MSHSVTAHKHLIQLESEITKAIDKICQDSSYEVTYAEINLALTKILERNIYREVQSLIKGEE